MDFFGGKRRLSYGDPLEYLDRLILHDEIFGEMTTFIGIGGLPNHRRIITRQARAHGRPASEKEIRCPMIEQLGFEELKNNYAIGYEESLAFIHDEAAVFDLRPANVLVTDKGCGVRLHSGGNHG